MIKISALLALAICFALAPARAQQTQQTKDEKKAPKLCAKHPTLTAGNCLDVAQHKLTIGITREMVLAEKPHACVHLTNDRDHRTKTLPAGSMLFECVTQWDHTETRTVGVFAEVYLLLKFDGDILKAVSYHLPGDTL
jgi:hypothetical protein